jgi:ubiquinone/menaquinone biosynthesis C-methylase UbiE
MSSDAITTTTASYLDPHQEHTKAGPEIASTREAWDRIAPGYDRTNTPTQMWLGNETLLRSGLRSGMRFLDVASGSGALSIPAARLGAEVVAIDQSPIMLELLERRASNEGLSIATRIMDGHALELEDNSFDMAGSQFGVMLFPDMPKGIREMARVVKPGGRVVVTAYGNPQQIEFLGLLVEALRSVGPGFEGPPMDPPPLPFQLSDPDKLREALIAAGLNEVKVEQITECTTFRTGEELWDWIVWSNPIVEEVLGCFQLVDDERGIVRQALEILLRQRAGEDGLTVITNPINIGFGTK